MKAVFLTFLSPHRRVWGFPFGPASLSAVLEQDGHSTMHLVGHDLRPEEVEETVRGFGADLICVSSTTDAMDSVREFVPALSGRLDVPVVLGGVHASAAPDESLRIPGLLGVCRGEGETALLELVHRLESGKDVFDVRNFWFNKDGRVVKNPVRPLIADLDSLPFPNRRNFDYGKLLRHTDFGLEFSAGRGCPFDCSFCVNPTLRGIYGNPGNYVRRRSVDNLLREVKEVAGRHPGVRKVTFHDDVFTLDGGWIRDFSAKYPDQVGLPFRINVHAALFDRERALLVKKAGCEEVAIGVETGDEKLRNQVLCKKVSDSQIISAFRAARDAGLKTRAFNMIGVPGETEETLRKTVEFNRRLGATYVNAPFFRPYPGTRLYEMCRDGGLLREEPVTDYLNETMLKLPTVSDERLYFHKRSFNFLHDHPWAGGLLDFLEGARLPGGATAFGLLHSVRRMFGGD